MVYKNNIENLPGPFYDFLDSKILIKKENINIRKIWQHNCILKKGEAKVLPSSIARFYHYKGYSGISTKKKGIPLFDKIDKSMLKYID